MRSTARIGRRRLGLGMAAVLAVAALVTRHSRAQEVVVRALGTGDLHVAETLRRWPQVTWAKYVFIAIDCAYLAWALIMRNSFASDLPPVALAAKEGALLCFVAFLVPGAFSYSPRFILWTGFCISLAWGTVVGTAAAQPGTFFTLTGFHGAHVFVGVLWLLTLLVRSFQGKLGPDKALNVEIAGLYWHFVDVVWIVIFTVVYLIQTTPLPAA